MEQDRPAVHHSIVVTDVENFTDPHRTNLDQLVIRHSLYEIIRSVFALAGVDWRTCRIEDRGDGVFILIPSGVPKALLATRVLNHLEAALGRYNSRCLAHTGIRLRLALHAGEVHYDGHGVTGCAINHVFRLVEATAVKAALKESSGQLAIIVSDWFYEEVIRHYPAAEPGSYRRVRVMAASVPAWVRLPTDSRLETINS